jgi:hypothetical protein
MVLRQVIAGMSVAGYTVRPGFSNGLFIYAKPSVKPDVKLSSGRVVVRTRMDNGAIAADVMPGRNAMTNAEYDEFIDVIKPSVCGKGYVGFKG